MSRLTLRLPNALHTQLEILARSEGVSLNQYLVYALTRQATLDESRHAASGRSHHIPVHPPQALDSPQAAGGGDDEITVDLNDRTDD